MVEQHAGVPDSASPAPPVLKELYASANIHVSAHIVDPCGPVCVTFAGGGEPRSPFATKVAVRHRLNIIAVTSRDRDWYQYRDLPDAEAAIRAAVCTAPRVVTYGSSMGAYAALLCSSAIGADAVLAMSPQAAIGPGCPATDLRWTDDQARIGASLGFPHDDMAGRLMRTGEVIVAYDPLDDDVHHVRMIEAIRPVRRLTVPLAGHNVVGLLSKLELASRLLTDVVHDRYDHAAWQADIHATHRRHPRRIRAMIIAGARRKRPIARALLARAVRDVGDLDHHRLLYLAHEAVRLDDRDSLTLLIWRLHQQQSFRYDPRYAAEIVELVAASAGAREFDELIAAAEVTLTEQAEAAPLVAEHFLLAALYVTAGRPERARRHLMMVANLVGAWDPWNEAIGRLFELADDQESAAVFKQRVATRAAPTFAAFKAAAGVHEVAGQWQDAIRVWQDALAAGVCDDRVHLRMARALSQLGQDTEALATLAPALAAPVVLPEVLKHAGMCHARMKQADMAHHYFERALQAVPGDHVAARMLGNSYAARGEWSAALQMALKVQSLKPSPQASAQVARMRQRLERLS